MQSAVRPVLYILLGVSTTLTVLRLRPAWVMPSLFRSSETCKVSWAEKEEKIMGNLLQQQDHINREIHRMFRVWVNKNLQDSNAAELIRREDEKYVYYDLYIVGILPETVKVQLERSRVVVRGEIRRQLEVAQAGSYIHSKIIKVFPKPEGVRPNQILSSVENNWVFLKFPKDPSAGKLREVSQRSIN